MQKIKVFTFLRNFLVTRYLIFHVEFQNLPIVIIVFKNDIRTLIKDLKLTTVAKAKN